MEVSERHAPGAGRTGGQSPTSSTDSLVNHGRCANEACEGSLECSKQPFSPNPRGHELSLLLLFVFWSLTLLPSHVTVLALVERGALTFREDATPQAALAILNRLRGQEGK